MIKKIKLLTDGNFEIDLGLLVYGKTPYYGKKYMAALKPLLVVTESDNILIDSGAGELPEKYQKYQKVEREVGLVDSLKNEDLSPDDISIVINTHLHFDHCGGNKLFSNAKFYVQAKEREYVENPHRFMKGGYIRDYYEDINFEMLKGERWIVEDELEVIPTPGHTPGHQSVLIEAEDKKYIYCGDVAPLEENLRDRNIVGILFNPVQALESLDYINTLEGIHIYCHDREQLTL